MKTKTSPQAKLNELLALPVETEWLEFKEAKNNYPLDKLGQYFSALSNEANLKNQSSAWLVFGVTNKHVVVGTQFRLQRADLDSLKKEIADQVNNRLTFTEIYEVQHPQGRVLLFEIPPAPAGLPTAWQGHFYGRDGESIGPLNLAELEYIRQQTRHIDWSAQICEHATLTDLDPAALTEARKRYKEKHPNLVSEVDSWSNAAFLNKAKVTKGGKITNTAIILLGREESAHLLSPAQAQITWVLKEANNVDRDYRHYGPPFLLNTDLLLHQIRNLTFRYLPQDTLFPTEVTQYDPWVIRELLHNCIAHQDYTLHGRVNVVEQDDSLLFTNLGGFIPQSVEQVINLDAPPDRYRNPFLAQAMVGLNMIDTIGIGIRRAFTIQQKRFFPLPDYDLSVPQRVSVRLLGKILDENYSRILMNDTDLSLREVIALDRVQKKHPISDDEFRLLKQKKLVEGRRPNLFVTARLAQTTKSKAAYIRNRAFDKTHYKKLVLEYLREFRKANPSELEDLLLDKLPDILNETQKKNKIRNLIQEMARKDHSITNTCRRGQGAAWALKS